MQLTVKAFACLIGFGALTAFATGCASSSGEDLGTAEGATTSASVEQGTTQSFAGVFTARNRSGEAAPYHFRVSEFDWNAGRAAWYSRFDDDAGELRIPLTIDNGRCPSCFDFIGKIGVNEAVRVTITEGRLHSLEFHHVVSADARITTVDNGGSGPSTGGASALPGSCSLVCAGDVLDCKDGETMTSARCKADSFDALPRCPYTVEFKVGGTCPRIR